MGQYDQTNLQSSRQSLSSVSSVQNQAFHSVQFSSNSKAGVQAATSFQTQNQNSQIGAHGFTPPPQHRSTPVKVLSHKSTAKTASVTHESPEILALEIYANVFQAMTGTNISELEIDDQISYLKEVEKYVNDYIADYFDKHFSKQDKIRLLAGQKYGGAGVYARFPDIFQKYQEAFSDLISKLN